jgi:hypothetical protein
VFFQPAGESDRVSTVTNRQVRTGRRLWAENGAQAELHIGSATIRVDRGAGFSFLNLDDRTVQISEPVNRQYQTVRFRKLFRIDRLVNQCHGTSPKPCAECRRGIRMAHSQANAKRLNGGLRLTKATQRSIR